MCFQKHRLLPALRTTVDFLVFESCIMFDHMHNSWHITVFV